MKDKTIFKNLAKMFLESDITQDGNEISISFNDKDQVLPAMKAVSDVLDDVDERRLMEGLGFDDDYEYEGDI
jgi:hypothetical protein